MCLTKANTTLRDNQYTSGEEERDLYPVFQHCASSAEERKKDESNDNEDISTVCHTLKM